MRSIRNLYRPEVEKKVIGPRRGGAPSEEAQAAFLEAMSEAGELRIEPIED